MQPLSPHTLQRHNGYVYAVAHLRDVNCDYYQDSKDGNTLVDIDAGFDVAPGDASDVEVTNAHPWGSSHLLFSDGGGAYTSVLMKPNAYKYLGMS